jgi:hypothetical protein
MLRTQSLAQQISVGCSARVCAYMSDNFGKSKTMFAYHGKLFRSAVLKDLASDLLNSMCAWWGDD